MDTQPTIVLPTLDLPGSSLPIDLSFTLLLFVIVLYGAFSTTLCYHWQAYAENGRVTSLTLISYFASTLPLVFIIITTLLVL